MKRRNFLRNFAAGGSILVTVPLVFEGCTQDDLNSNASSSWDLVIDLSLANFGTLKNIGGYAYQGNAIIIRNSISQYQALSKICTHQSCTLTYLE